MLKELLWTLKANIIYIKKHLPSNNYKSLFQTPSSPGLPYVHSIPRVTQSDQGMYTCVARNVVGKAYAAAYLQVNGSDHITR